MPDSTPLGQIPRNRLPIPVEQLHYADPLANEEGQRILTFVDRVQYPTLGCPALVGPGERLAIVVSLDEGDSAEALEISLLRPSRPRTGQARILRRELAEVFEGGASGTGSGRVAWLVEVELDSVPAGLYDLEVRGSDYSEIQYNAVKRYDAPLNRVVFSGDSQFNVDNAQCLRAFVDQINGESIDWIALIGDVCDNGVKSERHMLSLALSFDETIEHYYGREYPEAHRILRDLEHPIFLMVGNHDGMAHNPGYQAGSSQVFVGPDADEHVACDGLHHFRRTFGPLYYAFDWAGARYICVNSFELPRAWRLAYHAVVANWGGWMTETQLDWLEAELDQAGDRHKVVLLHHDPRGGSKGEALSNYHEVREYEPGAWKTVRSYVRYAAGHGRRRFQQEWMRAPEDMEDNPAGRLLRAMLEHRVDQVFMGHDNVTWYDSYGPGHDLFSEPGDWSRITLRETRGVASADTAEKGAQLAELIEREDFDGVEAFMEEEPGSAVMEAAVDRLDGEVDAVASRGAAARGSRSRALGPGELMELWDLEIHSRIDFLHVDDIGAYDLSDLEHYGYVVAELRDGLPAVLDSIGIERGKSRGRIDLGRWPAG